MISLQSHLEGIDWQAVADLLREVGMAHYPPEVHRAAFEQSTAVRFLFDEERLVGFGRVLSDRAYQAVLYDLALHPAYQGRGLGRRLVEALLEPFPDCNVILYAAPGKEAFYERLGFRRMKTGLARFCQAGSMRERGFTE